MDLHLALKRLSDTQTHTDKMDLHLALKRLSVINPHNADLRLALKGLSVTQTHTDKVDLHQRSNATVDQVHSTVMADLVQNLTNVPATELPCNKQTMW